MASCAGTSFLALTKCNMPEHICWPLPEAASGQLCMAEDSGPPLAQVEWHRKWKRDWGEQNGVVAGQGGGWMGTRKGMSVVPAAST